MIFDESGDLKNMDMKNDKDLIDIFKIKNIEDNRPEGKGNPKYNGACNT